jgi:hypothetical protein
MSEATLIQDKTCFNCHYECVEHLKYASKTCTSCLNDTKINFPNWKAVEKES